MGMTTDRKITCGPDCPGWVLVTAGEGCCKFGKRDGDILPRICLGMRCIHAGKAKEANHGTN